MSVHNWSRIIESACQERVGKLLLLLFGGEGDVILTSPEPPDIFHSLSKPLIPLSQQPKSSGSLIITRLFPAQLIFPRAIRQSFISKTMIGGGENSQLVLNPQVPRTLAMTLLSRLF
jgi:hypothetical protein